MLRAAKVIAERLLLQAGPAALSRKAHGDRALVLAYHNIVPDGERVTGDASLHLPRPRFSEQLDQLMDEGIRVVALDELTDAMRRDRGAGSRPLVAITFDDAYRGAVQVGIDELARRGLPATIFVTPGLLEDQTFWWDALSEGEDGLRSEVRHAALESARGRNEDVIAWARRQGLPVAAVPEFARSANKSELRAATGQKGISVASHTWSHANLLRLTDRECRDELERAASWMGERFDEYSDWLSYPYGLHDARVERVAAAVGCLGAFRIDGGWLPRSVQPTERFRLPRLNVPAGLSREGFALRIAGLLCG